MLVMVDVGALEPGNYIVAITDPSVVGGQGGGQVPSVQPGGNTPGASPQIQRPAGTPGRNVPENPTGRPVGQPQGNVQPGTIHEIPRSVLAQVVNDPQQNTGSSGTTIPATGQSRPLTAPATGQVNPSSTLPTGQSSANNELTNQINQNNAARTGVGNTGVGNTGNPAMNQIGTLTVDQSGTGRMQHVVEGLQVQAVVGQAIAIYAQNAATDQKTTLPPNLDATTDPAAGNATNAPQSNAAQNGQARPGATNGASGNNTPVAAGIIRLMNERGPAPTSGAATDDAFGPAPAPPQPANNSPPAGSNRVR